MAINVSSVGTVVTVSSGGGGFGGGGDSEIKDFADDADPIQIQPLETNDFKFDVNGDIVPFSKCTAIIVTISVIPNSNSDHALRGLVYDSRYDAGSYEQKELSMTICDGTGQNKYFGKGRVKEGHVFPSSNSDGRWKGTTYTFFFRDMNST